MRRVIYLAIPDHIQQCNNVWTTREVLEYLDLPLDLLLLDRLEDFDDTLLVADDVYTFEHLGVFPTAYVMSMRISNPLSLVARRHSPIFLTTS
jgi:hypothetical protein